jgi:hypothetical protein
MRLSVPHNSDPILFWKCWICSCISVVDPYLRIHMFLGLPDPDPSINKQKKLEKP